MCKKIVIEKTDRKLRKIPFYYIWNIRKPKRKTKQKPNSFWRQMYPISFALISFLSFLSPFGVDYGGKKPLGCVKFGQVY